MILAIASPSFNKNVYLCDRLKSLYPAAEIRQHRGPELSEAELVEFARDAELLLVGKERVNVQVLDGLPGLKGISKYGVGLDSLDLNAIEARGVAFFHKPGVNAPYVAEHALGMIIGLLRNLAKADRLLHQSTWKKDGGVSLWKKPVAIVGCGHCGSALGRLLRAFACDVYVVDIIDKSEYCKEVGATQLPLHEALELGLAVSLHVPLDDSTRNLIGPREFERMRPDGILINTSRGGIVDEIALGAALEGGELAGAAMDVFAEEPSTDNPLFSMENFMGSAHMAGNCEESVRAMGLAAMEGISQFVLKMPLS